MAHRLEFDFQHKILLVIHEGAVEGREIEQLADQLKPRLGELNPSVAISDFSEVTAVDIDTHMIRHLAMKDTVPITNWCLHERRTIRQLLVSLLDRHLDGA